MKRTYLSALAIASILAVGTVTMGSNVQSVSANPCAAADPCAGAKVNPCAAANPCAASNPCAAADPCAGAKVNPCAAADPCAAAKADPCAAANPCAASAKSVAVKTGNFTTGAHTTLGQASIVVQGGQRYLEFDQAFRSDSGPDLFVLLHQDSTPTNYSADRFVNLGELQSVSGKQRYAIPEGVSLANLNSAVIWCREFNVTFGHAVL